MGQILDVEPVDIPVDVTDLKNCVKRISVNSSNPYTLKLGDYGTVIFLGFAQGIGSIGLLIRKSGSSTITVINLNDNTAFSSSYFDVHIKSGDTSSIEITSSVASNSVGTLLVGYMAT